jgi:hypothetical protein
MWTKYSAMTADRLILIGKNPIKNYIIPGLESRVIEEFEDGLIRIFIATRSQNQFITPHSHRYNLTCKVMRGGVINKIWVKTDDPSCDTFTMCKAKYGGEPGNYGDVQELSVDRWTSKEDYYGRGKTYYMHKNQVHSIEFIKDTVLLLNEAERDNSVPSVYLEPNIDGQTINTFNVQPWMFEGVKYDN